MSNAFRILVVLACAGIVGCRSASERRQQQLRDLEAGSVEYHRVADDMALRGDRNPERRAAFEQTAIELDEKKKQQDAAEKEHPWATAFGNFFSDTIGNAVTGNDGKNEWDDKPGFEGSSATIGEFQ